MTRTRNRFAVLLLAAAPLCFINAIDVVHALNNEQVASLAPTMVDREFGYVRKVVRATVHVKPREETKNYRVFSLSFPSSGENGQPGNLVRALYYRSKLPVQKKVIIVLPIWGTHTYPSRKMVRSLLKYSDGRMNVLRILDGDYLFDWDAMKSASTEQQLMATFRRMAKRVRTHVIDIRRSIDWLERQPDIDPNHIGLVGFSIAAMVSSLVVAHEPRVAATVLAMGGANLHEMFATCFGRAEQARKIIMSRFGWTKEIFQKKLEKLVVPINPVRFTGSVDPKRVLMFEAKYDECIPKTGRNALWHAMGKPTRVIWPYGHKMAFLTMTFLGLNSMRRKIYDFLEQTL
ncbi:MAG: dienelactone hydrolase family protein [Gammaproteobacteria bacterium]|nr:dienelactone hydrolase family protein [Gammaproteobacteria bacterium]